VAQKLKKQIENKVERGEMASSEQQQLTLKTKVPL
jgi:hypothetical protein